MPSDDLILNVRQIAGYPPVTTATAAYTILMQQGGLGGPYVSISPEDLVGTALMDGGDMTVAGTLTAFAVNGGSLAFSNGVINAFSSSTANIQTLNLGAGFLNGEPLATQTFVANVHAQTVSSFNWRRGDVVLDITDITQAGGAPLYSPQFQGVPTAPEPDPSANSGQLATTHFVQSNIAAYINYVLTNQDFVFTFNGRTGNVVLTAQDIIDAGGTGEIFDSPIFTGNPTAPTPPRGDNDTSIATTAFVQDALTSQTGWAPINSPVFTGVPQGPTAAPGSNTGQLATTAFVKAAVTAATTGVASFNTRTGAVTLIAGDITSAGGALLASPAFTGVPTAPTATAGTATGQLATTQFVTSALAAISGGVSSFNTRTGAVVLTAGDITTAGGALLASPALSGSPTAPTPPIADSSTRIATTAFVMSELANAAVQSFNGRVGAVTLNAADISAAGGAAINSPAFTGTPSAPTAAPGTNTTQLATTAFVTAALTGAGVTSFNTRTGAVVLTIGDVTGVGGAPLVSPSFSGVPTSPTPNVGDSSQKIATTAFVAAALAGGAGVSSFNTRTGAVTLIAADLTAAGGALLSSPAFTGSPTAPTAVVGTNSTVLATTAFVQAAITAGGVVSFNGRNGVVTLNSADISAAGGAVLASPAFTGNPTAPTPTAGDNDTSIATTAFVQAAVNAAGGVVSFNGRAGAVTLSGADLTSAGGALLASPAFTGNPTAPTATAGTNSTVLATTAFVAAAVSAVTSGYLPLTGGTLTGPLATTALTVTAIAGGGTSVNITGPSTSYRGITATTGASIRWALEIADNGAETGSNVGSNFAITRYSDAGANLSTPFSINRATGNVVITGSGLYVQSAAYNQNTLNFLIGASGAVGAVNNVNSLNFSAQGLVVESGATPIFANKLGGNGIAVQMMQGGTACGSITVANANSTAYNTASDITLKDAHAIPKKYANSLIDKLKPIEFNWRDAPDAGTHYGFSAQEVHKDFPTAVAPGKGKPGEQGYMPWMMDYSKLVPVLVAELKDLRARLAALEKPARSQP
jgi:hypothetical protein